MVRRKNRNKQSNASNISFFAYITNFPTFNGKLSMNYFLSFMFFLFIVVSGNDIDPNIVGGVIAAKEYPWVASLRDGSNFHFCGGSLIAPNLVLTAAHCVVDRLSSVSSVVFGDYTLYESDGVVARPVTLVIVHPEYNDKTADNDLAVLVIGGDPVPITPVDLDMSGTLSNTPGEQLDIVGWGATKEGGGGSKYLRIASVNVVDHSMCNKALDGGITANMFCAAARGKDSCQGDSGGPIFKRGRDGVTTIAGVVSWGYGCARKGYPGVYATLSPFVADPTNPSFRCKSGFISLNATQSFGIQNYENNLHTCWELSLPSPLIEVKFDTIDLEDRYDTITITDDKHIVVSTLSGSQRNVVVVATPPVTIEMKTDESVTRGGFRARFGPLATRYPTTAPTRRPCKTFRVGNRVKYRAFKSGRVGSSVDKCWLLVPRHPNRRVELQFTKIDMEKNVDWVWVFVDGDKRGVALSGDQLPDNNLFVATREIMINVVSDHSVPSNGFWARFKEIK